MCGNCCKRSKRSGLTLVEVVFGLALLATLLVTLLMSYRAHAVQIRSAAARLEAIQLADQLLAGWSAEDAFPAVGDKSFIKGHENLYWRMVAASDNKSSGLGGTGSLNVDIVRLEILKRTPQASADDLLCAVELLVPGKQSPQL